MPGGPATILGGLPVWAEVSFTRGDGWTTDDDADVDELFWLKRDGTKGAPLSRKIWDRLDRIAYWQCDVIESVSEYLAFEQYEAQLMDVRCRTCDGKGVVGPWPFSTPDKYCPHCRGSGTFVSRVRAGLTDYMEFR